MTFPLYNYRGIIRSVYDGDSGRMDIDLGFDTWLFNVPYRLWGVNTPEVRGPERPEGIKVRDAVREVLLPDRPVLFHSKEREKYGRILLDATPDGWELPNGMDGTISDWLIWEKMARPYLRT